MLEQIRAAMHAAGVDMYLVPSADPHSSEYPGEHFKVRQYLSGFTGSAGTLLIENDSAALWTDGRYFLQAEQQLAGSGIRLFRIGEPDVPSTFDYIQANIRGSLGVDCRTLSTEDGLELESRGIAVSDCPDVIDKIWIDRPPMSALPAYSIATELSGKSAADKIAELRLAIRARGADAAILTALDDTAWLLNIRGDDVKYLPVALCFSIIEPEAAFVFMEQNKAKPILGDMAALGITVLPYERIYTFLDRYMGKTVVAAKRKLNYGLYKALKSASIIDWDPIAVAKAVKNSVELANMRATHIKDGVAVTRLIMWIKDNANAGKTELQISRKASELRREQAGNMGESFATICGYGAHAAIIHYKPTEETDIPIEPKGLLLVDSGGQYIGGTTDVTRTIAVGPVESEQQEGFTLVLESMLSLMYTRFPQGCAGYNLDAIARAPFWERGMDFNHGTGHGVGYMLSVHEGPNGFRWKKTARSDRGELMPGMITSDEPGIYVEGKYGVRTENLLECVADAENPRFLAFRPLTFVPIDLDAINLDMLSDRSRERLNRYHAEVYKKLSPYMTETECARLKAYTRAI